MRFTFNHGFIKMLDALGSDSDVNFQKLDSCIGLLYSYLNANSDPNVLKIR